MAEEITEKGIDERVFRRNNVVLAWAFAGILFVFGIIILIIVKMSKPEFPFLKIIYWFLGIAIVTGGIGGGFQLYTIFFKDKKEESKSDKLPPAIKTLEAKLRAIEKLKDEYFDEIAEPADINGSLKAGKVTKTNIYTLAGKGKLSPDRYYVVMINQHFPDEQTFVFLASGPKDPNIWRYRNFLSYDPEEEPDVERIITENPFTQTKQIIERKGKKKEEKEEKKKIQEAL